MTPRDVVESFVEAVNSHEVGRLAALTTEDHVFIDSDGTENRGRQFVLKGWRGYFAVVPDYRIIAQELFAQGSTVILIGEAEGTFVLEGRLEPENHWRVPAAWRAVVRNGKVAVWQLYVNPEPMARILERVRGE
ncbi:MAG: nuclear transport factor 2 family protein [Candidatus Aminicenantes bacterium]|nr:nuclear transport factor 2 family protein [Candidatus Aminicenantes bacterium]